MDLKFKSAHDPSNAIWHHPSPRPPPILQSHLTLELYNGLTPGLCKSKRFPSSASLPSTQIPSPFLSQTLSFFFSPRSRIKRSAASVNSERFPSSAGPCLSRAPRLRIYNTVCFSTVIGPAFSFQPSAVKGFTGLKFLAIYSATRPTLDPLHH